MKKISKYLIGIAAVIAVLAIGSFPALALGHSSNFVVAAAPTPAAPFATQVKLLAVAGSVFAILQAAKQVFPISGIGSVIFNVVLNAIGVIVAIKPDDLFSLNTITAVAIAGLTAAGAHGTWRSFTDSGGSSGSTAARSTVAVLLCFLLIGSATGCSPVEVQAYRTIVGAKAFTTSISKAHPECGTRDANNHWVSAHKLDADGDPDYTCQAIDKSIAAKDVLIDLAEAYCAGPDFESGGKCNPPTDKNVKDQLASKLTAALSLYSQTETNLKTLLH